MHEALLGGPWAVKSGVMSRVTIVISPIRGLITRVITTHEPLSMHRTYDLTLLGTAANCNANCRTFRSGMRADKNNDSNKW